MWVLVKQSSPVTNDAEVGKGQFWFSLSLFLQESRPAVPQEDTCALLAFSLRSFPMQWWNWNPSSNYDLSLSNSSPYWQTCILLLSVSLCLNISGTSWWVRLLFHQSLLRTNNFMANKQKLVVLQLSSQKFGLETRSYEQSTAKLYRGYLCVSELQHFIILDPESKMSGQSRI